MTQSFDYFVLFADMRTGSNLLEASLNEYPGVTCHGEAFNPHFIAYPNETQILGTTQAMRDADPLRLVRSIRDDTDGLGGFRFFHDHDPRILEAVLGDRSCAKIILTRNPVDSYVSWKIAQATGQWKLTDARRRKDSRIDFDASEFKEHLTNIQQFQIKLQRALQVSGQTAFYIGYDDLQDVEIINGLANWLGVESELPKVQVKLKKQNPEPMSEKVRNFDDMKNALAALDTFNLSRTPNFEPRRGAHVPSFVAAAKAPLLHLPIRSGPVQAVTDWMASLDGVTQDDLKSEFSQKTLRQWFRANPSHRSFAVLRHPAARAHDAFCKRILQTGPGCFTKIRKMLRNAYNLPLPGRMPDDSYTAETHRAAFFGFLGFVKANLAEQTAIRVDAHWASQVNILQGFAGFILPDVILREDELEHALPELARQIGYDAPPPVPASEPHQPYALGDIYDDEIEDLVAQIYQRDYLVFGFKRWR